HYRSGGNEKNNVPVNRFKELTGGALGELASVSTGGDGGRECFFDPMSFLGKALKQTIRRGGAANSQPRIVASTCRIRQENSVGKGTCLGPLPSVRARPPQ